MKLDKLDAGAAFAEGVRVADTVRNAKPMESVR